MVAPPITLTLRWMRLGHEREGLWVFAHIWGGRAWLPALAVLHRWPAALVTAGPGLDPRRGKIRHDQGAPRRGKSWRSYFRTACTIVRVTLSTRWAGG